MSKETRNKIVENLKNKCKLSRMSDHSTGIMLRACHTNMPISYMIISLFAPHYIVNLVIASLGIIFVMFFAFGGCILSMVENKICNDDFTIADPFLELLQLEKNSNNRYNITCAIGSVYCIIIAIVYYVRFIYNKSNLI